MNPTALLIQPMTTFFSLKPLFEILINLPHLNNHLESQITYI